MLFILDLYLSKHPNYCFSPFLLVTHIYNNGELYVYIMYNLKLFEDKVKIDALWIYMLWYLVNLIH